MSEHYIILLYVLIVIDTATKWVALGHLIATAPGLLAAIKAIPQAHRERVIDSGQLKRGFSSKIMTYMILIASGTILDFILDGVGNPRFFIPIVIPFLAFTEFLSIVENLDQAGISLCANLVAFVKNRGFRRNESDRFKG